MFVITENAMHSIHVHVHQGIYSVLQHTFSKSQSDNQKQALLDECCNEWDRQVLSIDNTIIEHLESTELTKRVDHVQQPALQVRPCTSENTQYNNIKGCSLHIIGILLNFCLLHEQCLFVYNMSANK